MRLTLLKSDAIVGRWEGFTGSHVESACKFSLHDNMMKTHSNGSHASSVYLFAVHSILSFRPCTWCQNTTHNPNETHTLTHRRNNARSCSLTEYFHPLCAATWLSGVFGGAIGMTLLRWHVCGWHLCRCVCICVSVLRLPGGVLYPGPPHLFPCIVLSPAAVPALFSWQPVRFALILGMRTPCSLWCSPSLFSSPALCFHSSLSVVSFFFFVLLCESDVFLTLCPANRDFLTNQGCFVRSMWTSMCAYNVCVWIKTKCECEDVKKGVQQVTKQSHVLECVCVCETCHQLDSAFRCFQGQLTLHLYSVFPHSSFHQQIHCLCCHINSGREKFVLKSDVPVLPEVMLVREMISSFSLRRYGAYSKVQKHVILNISVLFDFAKLWLPHTVYMQPETLHMGLEVFYAAAGLTCLAAFAPCMSAVK